MGGGAQQVALPPQEREAVTKEDSGWHPSLLTEFFIVHQGLDDAEPPKDAQFSLRSKDCVSGFWAKRQDTPRSGECNDQASHAPSAGTSVCLPPLADMPKNRQSALRESVWAPCVANSDPRIALRLKTGRRDDRAFHSQSANESENNEIQVVQSWPQRQNRSLHNSEKGPIKEGHSRCRDNQAQVIPDLKGSGNKIAALLQTEPQDTSQTVELVHLMSGLKDVSTMPVYKLYSRPIR